MNILITGATGFIASHTIVELQKENHNIIGVDNYLTLGYLMSFMVSVQIYHLIFDLFAWLPCFFHKLLEKSNIGE